MVNESEKLIREKYEKQGYKSLKNGFPDFVFFREDDQGNVIANSIFFCEVKGMNDAVRLDQYKYMEILKSLGLNVKLEIVNVINTTTYNNYGESNPIYERIKKMKKEGYKTEKIAVQLTKEFNISRPAFYRYFKRIKDLQEYRSIANNEKSET